MVDERIEWDDIHLMADRHAVNKDALVPELGQHLGGKTEVSPLQLPADVRGVNITLRICERPYAVDLAALCADAKQALPPEYAAAIPHRLCLILIAVSVMNEGSYERIQRIGLQVQLPDDPRVRIFGMFPQPELVSVIQGELTCCADVQIDGQANVPAELPLGCVQIRLPFGVSVQTGAGGRFVGRFSFSVYSRAVAAVGLGDSQAQWVITRHDRPLDGHPHLFGLIVSTRKVARALMLKANVYAIVSNVTSLYTFPIRLQQPVWKDIPVRIEKAVLVPAG